ncbi:hypothetical protein N9L66_00475 [Porticoccaceae bacterium]|nr:hypothetical protein [Porticoccaceae bacterium]
MSSLNMPLERPVSKSLDVSFHAIAHSGPVNVHTVVYLTPDFDQTPESIDKLLSMGFQAQTDLKTGDTYFLTSNILDRGDWVSIDPSITEFEFLQKGSIRNLKANVQDVVPLPVADLLMERYTQDSVALGKVMSDITNSEVDDAVLRELITDVVEGVYNKQTASAMIYATGELVASDARGLRSRAILKNYNECLRTLGEYEIKSLDSIVSTEYLKSVTSSVPSEGVAALPGNAPREWPDLSIFHEKVGFELDSIDTIPVDSVAIELEKLLPKFKNSDEFRRAKNVVVNLNGLSNVAKNLRNDLTADGFLSSEEPFHFEYFAGSIQLTCRDKSHRSQARGKTLTPSEMLSSVSAQAKRDGSAELQLGALLYRTGWQGADELKKVNIRNFVSDFKKQYPDFVFRFYDESDPSGDSISVIKIADDAFISVPEFKKLPLDSISIGENIKQVLTLHNDKHADSENVLTIDIPRNTPKINRAQIAVRGREPGGDEPINFAKITALVRGDLSATYGMGRGQLAEKSKEIANRLIGGGICVYGENKQRSISKSITPADIFEVYNGNRRLAADACLREFTNEPGFTMGAKFRVYDALELQHPETFTDLDNLNQRGEPIAPPDIVENGARRDLGVVAGTPRKAMNIGKRQDASALLIDLAYSELKEAASKKSLWIVRQKERLEAKGVDPGVAFLELNYRNNFPSQCFDLSNLESIDFYARSLGSLRDLFAKEGATVASVKKDLRAWHKEFFPLSFDRAGRASFGSTGTQNWSEHQRQMWISPVRGKAPFSAFVTNGEKGNAIQVWMKTAKSITWSEFLKRSEVKKIKRISWSDLPHLSHLSRKGPHNGPLLDTRSAELMLLEDFNFSGIEYGDWINNAEGDEHMFYTYNSMADLATALDVPNKALSLGGNLGLCFGSRGQGGHRAGLAHFESDNCAINLTRMHGAGSLAHEYAHALGNYFAKNASPLGSDMFKSLSGGSDTVAELNKDPTIAGNMRPELYKKWIQLYDTVMYKPSPAIKGAMVESDFVKKGKDLDSFENRKKPYWGAPKELFARAMERYFNEKLEAHGIYNNYLLRPDRFGLGGGGIYPSDSEMLGITRAMDGLVKEIKLQETQITHDVLGEISVPVMYSHDLGASGIEMQSRSMLARMAVDDIHRMIGDRTAILVTNSLVDENNKQVAGAWDVSKNIIKLASLVGSREMVSQDAVNHEVYHAAEAHLLTKSEVAMLDRHLEVGTPMYQDLIRIMDAKGLRSVVNDRLLIPEERRAYAFQYYASGELKHKEPEAIGVLAKVKELLANIYNTLRGAGYTKPQDLFRDLKAGELAHRSFSSKFKNEHEHSLSVDQDEKIGLAV